MTYTNYLLGGSRDGGMLPTPELHWHKRGDTYVEQRGRARIDRHEIDDTWDEGALCPTNVQWIRYTKSNGQWVAVEQHNTLGEAKQAAARAI